MKITTYFWIILAVVNLISCSSNLKNETEKIQNSNKGTITKEAYNFNENEFSEAITKNNFRLVEKYLENGRDPDAPCTDGLVPIVKATFEGNINVIDALMDFGANPSATFDTRPALSISIMFNDIETAMVLIDAGADIDAYDGPKITPLMFAIDENNIAMVDILLGAGADITLEDVKNETALTHALKGKNDTIIGMIKDRLKNI